tara:strand:- start:129 stop:290 length:162 start_codon:yes stop_codon:yes gene_type:complete
MEEEQMIHKIFKKLGLADQYGYCDTSIVGFIVLWSAFGYGAWIALEALIKRFV